MNWSSDILLQRFRFDPVIYRIYMYVIRRHTTLLDTRPGEMEERHYGQCIKTGPQTYMVYGDTSLR